MSFLVFEFDKIITPKKLEEILILSSDSIGWKHKKKSNLKEVFNTGSKKIEKVHDDYSIKFSGSFLPMAFVTLPKNSQNWIGISYGFGFGFSTSREFNNFLEKLYNYSNN